MCAFFPGRNYTAVSKFSKGHLNQAILKSTALCRTDLWLPSGRKAGRVMDQEFGVSGYKL